MTGIDIDNVVGIVVSTVEINVDEQMRSIVIMRANGEDVRLTVQGKDVDVYREKQDPSGAYQPKVTAPDKGKSTIVTVLDPFELKDKKEDGRG